MEKGVWGSWQWLLGVVLAAACLSCQPRLAPAPPPPLPAPPARVTPLPPPRPTFYVRVDLLNLRAGPGMDFPKIGQLNRNEELEKVGEADDWFQVRVKRDGALGWVAARFLSGQPVPAAPETAAPGGPPAAPPAEAATPAETKPPPTKIDTVLPRAPKPVEAAEPPPRKPEPEEEPAPAPKPEALPAKPVPEPQPVEPPAPPAPKPPEEKPERIRIM